MYLSAPGGPSPQLANPLVSPAYLSDLGGLVQQQLLLLSGGVEAMVSDIRAFADKAKQASSSSGEQLVVYHEELNEPHCHAVLAMPGLLAKGSRVLVPFIAAMAACASAQT